MTSPRSSAKSPIAWLSPAGGLTSRLFPMHNPTPPGSMVVVGIEPTFRCMDRSGMATSTREVARKLWNDVLPGQDPRELVRILYDAENQGKAAPSGSQDMAGLIIPGISRLDYDFTCEGGYFPCAHRNQQRPRCRALAGESDPPAAHRASARCLQSSRGEKSWTANGSAGWANRGRTVTRRFWPRTRGRSAPP